MWRSGTDRGDTHDMRCVLSLGGGREDPAGTAFVVPAVHG
nr:MAG TPA: hypothetical protein [Caudoviricetes sp.]